MGMDDSEPEGRRGASQSSLAPLLRVLEYLTADGATALVKADGGREPSSGFTVVVSGGPLGSNFFRSDGGDLNELLNDAMAFYSGYSRATRPALD